MPVPLKITINENLSKKQVNNLKNLFHKYPGKSPVEILLKDSGVRARISIDNISVENCKELEEEISKTINLN